jgi:hypothetical protein
MKRYECELIMHGSGIVKSTMNFKSEKNLIKFFTRRKMCIITGTPNLIFDLRNMSSMKYTEVQIESKD